MLFFDQQFCLSYCARAKSYDSEFSCVTVKQKKEFRMENAIDDVLIFRSLRSLQGLLVNSHLRFVDPVYFSTFVIQLNSCNSNLQGDSEFVRIA